MLSLYNYLDYRNFLADRLPTSGEKRGQRAKLAAAIRCQKAFISQVIAGKQHLSQELAFATCEFLQLDPEETDFFLLLLQYARAGSTKLAQHFKSKIKAIQKKHEDVKKYIKVTHSIKFDDQVTFFSNPIYSQIQLLAMTADYKSINKITERLKRSRTEIMPHISWLEKKGLITRKGESIYSTQLMIHLGKNSPILTNFHSQWRLQAQQSIYVKKEGNIHFSSQFCCSEKDFKAIKKILLNSIKQSDEIIDNTKKNENVFAINLDIFSI